VYPPDSGDMTPGKDAKPLSGSAPHASESSNPVCTRTVRVVLQVRLGADTPFEGTVAVCEHGPQSFHGWLELMGLVEEARSRSTN
jgi:hypothetical protein